MRLRRSRRRRASARPSSFLVVLPSSLHCKRSTLYLHARYPSRVLKSYAPSISISPRVPDGIASRVARAESDSTKAAEIGFSAATQIQESAGNNRPINSKRASITVEATKSKINSHIRFIVAKMSSSLELRFEYLFFFQRRDSS